MPSDQAVATVKSAPKRTGITRITAVIRSTAVLRSLLESHAQQDHTELDAVVGGDVKLVHRHRRGWCRRPPRASRAEPAFQNASPPAWCSGLYRAALPFTRYAISRGPVALKPSSQMAKSAWNLRFSVESTSNCTVGILGGPSPGRVGGAINIFHDVQTRVRVAHVHHHGVGAGIETLHRMALLGRRIAFRKTIARGQAQHAGNDTSESDQDHIIAGSSA